MRKNNYNTDIQINSLIGARDSVLGQITKKASKIAAYQRWIRQLLEPSCREHCWLAGYHNGALQLQSDSSAWATRIRLQQTTLAKKLSAHDEFASIRSIKVIVRPHYSKAKMVMKARPMSTKTAVNLKQCAEGIEDKALRKAMFKLSQRG